MKAPFMKSLVTVVIGLGTIGICLIGYYINIQRQHQQRIDYAEISIPIQKDNVESLSKEIDKLYDTQKRIFLSPEITEETLSSLSSKLSSIKISADDYDIKESELPKEAAKVVEKKEAAKAQLVDAESKLKIQTAINGLFTKNVTNWQQAEDDVIIKEQLPSEAVAHVRENMSFFEDTPWKTVVIQYLSFADSQIAQVTQLDQLFNTMMTDGQVIDTSTYNQYLTALSQIEEIRNEKLRATYATKAQTIAQKVNYSNINY
ncbi:hypothetical protein IGI47_002072 [Enterococcus sp. AZ191]|uniref:hypothetical protein n=1 Tax=Enterococcus sp. AZ191 TaxID=2774639 RepID=UPI003F22E561